MKRFYFVLIFLLSFLVIQAQQEFHVFPKNHTKPLGTNTGNGSLKNPWDLQTALSQPLNIVNGDDKIWIHKGVYNGRYISTLKSTKPNKFITVSAYKNDKVILNGNVKSNKKYVLEVKGKNVIFKGFEVTWLGDFSRNQNDANFKLVGGISYSSGADCKFINLIVYNNPGSGFGSWKRTGGKIIDGCLIYNNGYISKKGRGSGVEIYVQNESNKIRLITKNTIFNNYYKGIEVWSDNGKATSEYVKNVTLTNNVIFNNGSPSGVFKDNLIIGTNDRNGINIAKNIIVEGNIFYHNTDFAKNQIGGDAASLTLGFNAKAPIENVKVINNIIIGRNNALRILHAKTLTFKNNISYCGYVHFNKSVVSHLNVNNWKFSNNTYYTKNARTFRISKYKDYTFNDWKSKYKIDLNSSGKHIREFNLKNVLKVTENEFKKNSYRVILFNKYGKDVIVNFSKFDISNGSTYKIIDIENRKKVIKSGTVNKDAKITFHMSLKDFENPLHNNKAIKTLDNFGVFIIEFKIKKRSFFERLFN
jgi:hypothetical protein